MRGNVLCCGNRFAPCAPVVVAIFVFVFVVVALPNALGYPRPGRTERVSVGSGAVQGNDEANFPSISADGRYVAFVSRAANLVPEKTNNNADIFVRDQQRGTTERVSVSSSGAQGNGFSFNRTSISADGRYVAFQSAASNLVPGDTNGANDIFVRDRLLGTTERISVASDGTQGNGASSEPWGMSADGRFVAFQSQASNLVSGDTNNTYDIFVRDRLLGVTGRVSVATDGTQQNAAVYTFPSISADGRYVAFESPASNLIAGKLNSPVSDVYVHDRQTGTTERVSLGANGAEGNDGSGSPSISRDGRYVAFYSWASNFVAGDSNHTYDIFMRDRLLGTTERISVAFSGAEPFFPSYFAGVSGDGRYVTFVSDSDNLVPGDTNNRNDIFVRDRQTGTTERVSLSSTGAQPSGQQSGTPAITPDGRYVVFQSFADNLVPGDNNGRGDIFVRDRGGPLAIGNLVVSPSGNQLSISGSALFSGTTITSASTSAGDPPEAGPIGADLTGADIVYRPEDDDCLFRVRLASLPQLDGAPLPGVVYGIGFTFAGVRYEVRATPRVGQAFLYRCDPACTQQAALAGGIGEVGNEMNASLPASMLAIGPGSTLTSISAFTAAADSEIIIDHVDLPDAVVPGRSVSLAIAPPGTPENELTFVTPASLTNGAFNGLLDASGFQTGYDVWARACLGVTCGPVASWRGMQLRGITSRKIHGSGGPFEIDLPPAGQGDSECRSGGGDGDYTLVFTFADSLTSVGSASVSTGTGAVINGVIGSDAHQYIVDLSGVTNAQTINVNLTSVSDAAGNFSSSVSGTMRVLIGDTTNDGTVNSADIAQTKSQSGQPVTSSNFREDVTVEGNINSADIAQVKSRSGTGL